MGNINKSLFNNALGLVAWLVISASAAEAMLVTVEPDDFSEGADISHATAGITLSASGTWPDSSSIFTGSPSFTPSTGELTFFHDGFLPALYRQPGVVNASSVLRADFDVPTDFVSIDFLSDNGDVGQLRAYNSEGGVIDGYTTGLVPGNGFETMTVETEGIKYIIASALRTDNDEYVGGLDHLVFNNLMVVPEPATYLLLTSALFFVAMRRKRAVHGR